MGVLPAWLRLVVWGVAGGTLSMGLYRLVSPQARILRGREQQQSLRRRLDDFDGELAAAWPLIGALLRASFLQVGRVAGPAALASLPVLSLLVWLSAHYGSVFAVGPDWARGWEATFLATLLLASIALKLALRIH